MSLRYKALIAVLGLVVAVTGSLVYFTSRLYTAEERTHIRNDLLTDAARLDAVLETERRTRIGALMSAMERDKVEAEFVNLFPTLGVNFDTKAAEWREVAVTDVAIAGLTSIEAKDRGATAILKTQDFWIVGADVAPGVAARRADIATAPAVVDAMATAFSRVRTVSDVVPAGNSLYLLVAFPFFRLPTEFVEFRAHEAANSPQEDEPYGVAAILLELSSAWARRNSFHTPGNEETPIGQVLFNRDVVTATTLEDDAAAKDALRQAVELKSPDIFEFPLTVRGKRETYIGLTRNFRNDRMDLSRPGFLALKSLDAELAPLHSLIRKMMLGGAGLAILGVLAAYGMAHLVIRKLGILQSAAEKVRGGDFSVKVDIRGRDEIGRLGVAFNNMTNGLRALGLYTDSKLAKGMLDNSQVSAGSVREEGTILFTDIKGFTSITESMDAQELTAQLNEYFTEIGGHVKEEDGYVDKFIGDAVMAFWGPPFVTGKDFAARACKAALLCRRAVGDLRTRWERQGRPLFFQRVGLATGEVVVGNIGSEAKKNFTVIGDAVNLASRLEGASKEYGTEILADERTIELAGNSVLAREIDEIQVRGRQKPVRVFELLGLANETNTKPRRLLAGYARALEKYRANDFKAALAALEELSRTDPDDGPSAWLRKRCAELLAGGLTAKPTHFTMRFQ